MTCHLEDLSLSDKIHSIFQQNDAYILRINSIKLS